MAALLLALLVAVVGGGPADANPFRSGAPEASSGTTSQTSPGAPSEAQESADPFRSGAASPSAEGAPAAPAVAADDAPGLVRQLWQPIWSWVRETQREITRLIAGFMADLAADRSPQTLFYGLFVCFLYGVFHTAGPGHGKVVVASYFLSHNAGIGRGLAMGAKIAITHVISAVVLVGLADISLRALLGGTPAEVSWVRTASYGAIALVGLWMLARAFGRVKRVRTQGLEAVAQEACCGHDHFGHDHAHDHGSDHVHDPHVHDHGPAPLTKDEKREQGLLSIGAGLVPCTGALLIMLFALANDLVFEGVLLVAAISAGMALAVSTIAVACIVARNLVSRRLEGRPSGALKFAIAGEVVGALAITAIGVLFLTASWA